MRNIYIRGDVFAMKMRICTYVWYLTAYKRYLQPIFISVSNLWRKNRKI